eukprot:12980982-Alexandrium_andersonii.AAC.1
MVFTSHEVTAPAGGLPWRVKCSTTRGALVEVTSHKLALELASAGLAFWCVSIASCACPGPNHVDIIALQRTATFTLEKERLRKDRAAVDCDAVDAAFGDFFDLPKLDGPD